MENKDLLLIAILSGLIGLLVGGVLFGPLAILLSFKVKKKDLLGYRILAVVLGIFCILVFILGKTGFLVVQDSGSMKHDGNFDQWWSVQNEFYSAQGITKEYFQTFPLKNGFNRGDMLIISKNNEIKEGDLILFKTSRPQPILHRVVAIQDGTYQTKGDHNRDSVSEEKAISPEQISGKAIFRIPYFGMGTIFIQNIFS